MKAFRLRLMSQALPFLLAAPGLVAIPAIAHAQQPPTAAEAQAALNPPPAQTYSQGQLDQMLAPIALYPDQVLMQVLMAATFPQQVIDAGQWLQDQNNAAIKGDALASALEPLPWDPSVKSLVAFPQIIGMMNEHMDWTQSLGVAFGGQQVAVMAEVQTLRNRAAAAGQFHSNAQIRYVHTGGFWTIEPVNPGEIYLPVYNPAVVYGQWQYPDYPPVYVPPPPDFVAAGYAVGPGIAFSVGFGVVAPLWGWGHPDWRRHELVINQARYSRITATSHFTENHVAIRNGAWQRTAPVVTVAAPQRAAPANAPHPAGTVAPAAIHAPPARPGAPAGAEEHRATPAQGAPAGEARPAPGTPPRPGEPAHPAPGAAPPRPGEPPHPAPEAAHPGPETAHPGAPPHPEEHAAPPRPGEPAHPAPEAAHPAEPPHPAAAPHPEEHAAPPHLGEPAHPAPEAAHPAEPPHPAAAPHPEEHAAPPHPAEPPHPAPEAAHPAAPPHPAEAPHPAPPPAPHPAAPPPAAHPPEPPHPAPAPAKPEEPK